ncbi:MAG: glucose-1-phosphate cytidylyltransferase [Draconibacterium sp.]
MDVIILCGGKGSRLSEETVLKPKPMVEIGDMPILWHIMKTYSSFGYKRFILALGYKASYIKEYFYNFRISQSDFSLNLNPEIPPKFFNKPDDTDWDITFVDTGLETLKGGRIKRLEKYIKSDSFHLTYGDGVSDIDISKLVEFHHSHNAMGTVTAVHPPSRFGEMVIDDDIVTNFDEKPQMHTGYINGGFFVFKKEMLDYLSTDENCDFEFGPLQEIVKDKQLKAFKHDGFWQPMDNIRERNYLDNLVRTQKAPWIRWK